MNPVTRSELAVKKRGFIYAFPNPHSSVYSVYTWIYFTVAKSLTFLSQSLFHLLYLSPLAHTEDCCVKCRAVYSIQFKIAHLGYEFLYGLLPRKQTLVREGT